MQPGTFDPSAPVAGPAAAAAQDRATPTGSRRCRSRCPPVEERAALPGGFRAGGAGCRHQALRAPRSGDHRHPARARRRGRRLHPQPGRGGAHPRLRRPTSTPPRSAAAAASAGPTRSSRRPAPRTRPRARTGTPTRPRSAGRSLPRSSTRAERILALSTGVIGVRLPVAKVRDGIARLVPQLAATDDGPRRGGAGDDDHRHEDQARHDARSSCRARTARRCG